MAFAPLPLMPNMESGMDVLNESSPVAVNVIIDRKGTVRRRPGITAYSGAPPDSSIDTNQVIGLYMTSGGKLFAVTGDLPGKTTLYHVTSAAGTKILLDTSEGRPTFAETEAMLVIANGRGTRRVLLSDLSVDFLRGSPPVSSHIIAHGARLLGNDLRSDKSRVSYSAPNLGTQTIAGHEQWGAKTTSIGTSGFFTAEARPDPVIALLENSNEVVVFGLTNVQTFAPDANLVYSSVSTREFGCSAAHGVIRDDQSFAWIDDRRRVVHSDGRMINIISDPIAQTLNDMSRVDDAYGFRVFHGPTDALVWTFPSDGRSLCWQRDGGWSLWMGWNAAGNNFKRFAVTAHTQAPVSADNIVGTLDGKIGAISSGAVDDLGEKIPAYVTTGYISHGTDVRKRSIAVRLAMRRGKATSGEPAGALRWRDDEGPWGSPVHIGLGRSDDREIVFTLRSLGVYRRRQWRFDFYATSDDVVLAAATEEYEGLVN